MWGVGRVIVGGVEMGNSGLEEPDALNFLHKGNANVM